MDLPPLTCAKCFTPLRSSVINTPTPVPCPGCGNPLQVELYPAFLRAIPRGAAAETVVQEGQATCFYHPQKTAHVPCDACGRFICALCDVELHGEHLCPGCVETGRRKGKITTLESRRTLHDNIALSLSLLPFIMWPITIATAPAAIIYAIATWKKPTSIAPRTKGRFIAAIIIGILTIGGWGFAIQHLSGVFQGEAK